MTVKFKNTTTSVDSLNKKITERRRMKDALQEANKFKDLVEALRDWVWETDSQGHYTYPATTITQGI